ncbi:glycosyltransferase [Nitrosomonas sp.]|uniref:glycosyltransferase family 2 protein n=1 Tax=Nitrosomonas sp. TaxID=42353 RepID=UPI0026169B0D|nr:glycosyltransferase [Nitrosomonas sp.]
MTRFNQFLVGGNGHKDTDSIFVISIIIPCFNAGNLLKEAVDSIRAQQGNFTILEIIIVDDHSTDPATLAVLDKCADVTSVKVMRNTRAKGPAGARNTGVSVARGNWLAFLDADDVWTVDSLAALVDAASAYPDVSVISGDFQWFDMTSGEIESNFFASRELTARYFGPAYALSRPIRLSRPYLDALFVAFCHSCSVLVNRDLFVEVGGFDERLRYKEDHHLWFKLAQQSDFVLVPKSIFLYRRHESNMTNLKVAPFDYERKMLDLILSEQPECGVADAIHRRYPLGVAENAYWFRHENQFSRAIVECFRGLRSYPTSKDIWRQLLGAVLRYR